jgi:hypothetical protein
VLQQARAGMRNLQPLAERAEAQQLRAQVATHGAAESRVQQRQRFQPGGFVG